MRRSYKLQVTSYKIKALFLLFFLIIYNLSFIIPTQAAISACSASVSPTVVPANSSVTLNFNVSNSDPSNSVAYVRIISGSSRFQITSGSSGSWSPTVDSSSQIHFSGSTIGANSSQDFSVTVQTSPLDTPAVSWTVELSDDGGGAGATGCSGSPSVAISSDPTPPIISNIQVPTIGETSATITWTTDENSSSSVDYGLTTSYGSSASGGGSTTSHSVNLSGLTSGTEYHFRVNSADTVGNNAQSGDNTLTTASSSSPGSSDTSSSSSSSSSSSNSSSSSTSTPAAVVILADKTPPVVLVLTDFSKPFKSLPVISGTVSDNSKISKVEYSVDGGKNWLPAILASKLAAKTTFTITTSSLEDGNYDFLVRAFDQAGNDGFTPQQILIIDQLPPVLGGGLFLSGSQILEPNLDGTFVTLPGQKLKLVLSSLGGSTSVEVSMGDQTFPLTQNQDIRLWSGELEPETSGSYELSAKAVDGAGNIVEKKLGQVTVLEAGQILSSGSALKDAKLSIYYFSTELNNFILWDGTPFGQQNPQVTKEDGRYNLVLPPGKYYLKLEKKGFQTLFSDIFKLDKPQIINPDFELKKAVFLSVGPLNFSLPELFLPTIKLDFNPQNAAQTQSKLIGQKLPNTEGGNLAIVTLTQSWFPDSDDQLQQLENVSRVNNLNILAVFPLESSASVQTIKKRNNLGITLLPDPRGEFSSSIEQNVLPSHIFLDNLGTITNVKSGFLSQLELEQNLIH